MREACGVFFWWASFFLLFGALTAQGATYRLFTAPGVQADNYDAMVAGLAPGDILVFSDDSRFEVKAILGAGEKTLVIDIGGDEALRIPLRSGHYRGNPRLAPYPYMNFIDDFVTGITEWKNLGIGTVEIKGHRAREYARVEKLKLRFSFGDFVSGKVKLSSEERARVIDQLEAWARSTWRVSMLSDLTENQLYCTDRGWVLLDGEDGYRLARRVRSPSVFRRGDLELFFRVAFAGDNGIALKTAADFHERVLGAIESERANHGLRLGRRCFELFRGLIF